MTDKEKNSIELTDFEKAVGVTIGTWNPKTDEQIQSVKAVANKLLNYARKELQKEHVSDSLEEAAKKAATQKVCGVEKFFWNDYHKFKAGANWQKQQMMKDVVDGEITIGAIGENLSIDIIALQNVLDTKRINARDKVKVLIIKQEEE